MFSPAVNMFYFIGDHLVYVDDMKSAALTSTGMEDFFSLGHVCSAAENTSFIFYGCVLGGDFRKDNSLPLPFHFYR